MISKISELIDKLEILHKEVGDAELVIKVGEDGDPSEGSISKLGLTKMYDDNDNLVDVVYLDVSLD